MDATHMISDAFQELERDLERALDGLTPEELTWRPENWANPIGFTLWHVTRAEDMWIHRYGLDAPHIFEQDGWASKWGIPPQDTGFGYEETTLDAFPNPTSGRDARLSPGRTPGHIEISGYADSRSSGRPAQDSPPPVQRLHRRPYAQPSGLRNRRACWPCPISTWTAAWPGRVGSA